MERYKRNNPEIKSYIPGIWKLNKKTNEFITCEHILPIPSFKQIDAIKPNLLPIYRNLFLKSKLSKINYHKCSHYLNSSQIMCINFFFPFIHEHILEIILKALGIALNSDERIDYPGVCFEKQSSLDYNKHSKTATSFDLFIPICDMIGRHIRDIFFEIKYIENGFGKKNINSHNIDLFNTVYKNYASAVLQYELCQPETFLENYQIARNLIHLGLDNGNYVIFVYPKGNAIIGKQGKLAKDSFLRKEYKNYLIVETWESLVKAVNEQPALPDRLTQQIALFCEKYLQIEN